MVHVVEHLPSKSKALSSNLSTAEKKMWMAVEEVTVFLMGQD
jgi:hypothetical protein